MTPGFEATVSRYLTEVTRLVEDTTSVMRTSALMSLDEARGRQDPAEALYWLLAALEYSVGVYHPMALEIAREVAQSHHPLAARVAVRYGLSREAEKSP